METVEEDIKTTDLMIMEETDQLDVTLEINPEDALIAVKKDI